MIDGIESIQDSHTSRLEVMWREKMEGNKNDRREKRTKRSR